MRFVTSYQQYRVKQGKIFLASCIGMHVGAEGGERERERKSERKSERESEIEGWRAN